jgi:hypothetical protein
MRSARRAQAPARALLLAALLLTALAGSAAHNYAKVGHAQRNERPGLSVHAPLPRLTRALPRHRCRRRRL